MSGHILAAAARAVIQIIGLAVVIDPNAVTPAPDRSAITFDPANVPIAAVDIVLPTVTGHVHPAAAAKPASASIAKSAKVTPQPPNTSRLATRPAPIEESVGVEPHIALLVYATMDALSGSTWTGQPFAPAPGYSSIELHGEHLQFRVNAPNPPLQMPNLRHLTQTCTRNDAGRPSLKQTYRPPAYTAAAAVVHLTEGTLSTCTAQIVSGGTRRPTDRSDTLLALDNDGTLEGGVQAGAPHYEVYGDMLDPGASCKWQQLTAGSAPPCDDSPMITLGGSPRQPQIWRAVDWQCSNSQYP